VAFAAHLNTRCAGRGGTCLLELAGISWIRAKILAEPGTGEPARAAGPRLLSHRGRGRTAREGRQDAGPGASAHLGHPPYGCQVRIARSGTSCSPASSADAPEAEGGITYGLDLGQHTQKSINELDTAATGWHPAFQSPREKVERRVMRRIPRRVKEQIRRRHAEGSSVSQLAREFRLTRSQIRRCLGRPCRGRPRAEHGLTGP